MLFLSFSGTVSWIASNGYSLMFIAMLIEGPIVTAAAAFVAALGYFNIWIVLLLSILGNLIPDAVCYGIGYWGREQFVDKYGHYLGLKRAKIRKMEKMIEKHAVKSLIAIKLIPLFATPGLVAAGATRMNLRKYIFWSFVITVPSSLFYLILGYYFGAAYDRVEHYLNIGYLIATIIILFAIVIYFARKAMKNIGERMEEDG